MTTQPMREKLHTIIDLLLDIENQGIATTDISIYQPGLTFLTVKDSNKVVAYSPFIYREADADLAIETLTKISTNDLSILPDYKAKVDKALEDERAKYEALRAKFDGETVS